MWARSQHHLGLPGSWDTSLHLSLHLTARDFIFIVFISGLKQPALHRPDTLMSWQAEQVERWPPAPLIQVNRRSGHCRGWSVWPAAHNPPRDYSTPVSHIIPTNHRSLFSHFSPAQPQWKNSSIWRKNNFAVIRDHFSHQVSPGVWRSQIETTHLSLMFNSNSEPGGFNLFLSWSPWNLQE